MIFDYLNYPYSSKRTAALAQNGVVATSQYLAAQAGLDMLKAGGNAVDAAIACAACLTVTEPTSNGIGGDAFAIIKFDNQIYGLNASGKAPERLNRDLLLSKGLTNIPAHEWESVTVPGAPAAWQTLSKRFGKLPLAKLLEPAVAYAERGYPVSPIVSYNWNIAFQNYTKMLKEEIHQEWFKVFTPEGRAPRPGEIWRSAQMAQTLQELAESDCESFYRGSIADRITQYAKNTNGYLTYKDLEDFQAQWVEPLSINYRGFDIWELPPNGQGLVVLLALNILKNFDLEQYSASEISHLQLEALKLAFSDGFKYIADPAFVSLPLQDLLADQYGQKRSLLIKDTALVPEAGDPYSGGTVYLAAADQNGNMVSYIQSNFTGFGSGIVIPDTAIALHNRGCGFNLDANHPNCLLPGKRPYHTIIPGFITHNDAQAAFGVMGALMQPQGHLQVIMNMIDQGLNPQAALDRPRWQWLKEKEVLVEKTFSRENKKQLLAQGHLVKTLEDSTSFGRGQIIWKNTDNVYAAGTEPRCDSSIACW